MSEENIEASGASEEQPTETEEKAREMGWRPQEEWDGDPERWMPAEEFVERNERLKTRGDKILQADNAKLTKELDELKHTVTDLKSYLTKNEQRAYQRALDDLKSKQRQAVEEGDTAAFDAVQKQMEKVQKQASEDQEQAPDNRQTDQGDSPEFKAWHAENPWYGQDPTMTVKANEIAPQLAPFASNEREHYDMVAKYIQDNFPDKFGKATGRSGGRRAPAVEGTTSKPASKTKFDDLPSDAKQSFQRFVKQGVFEDTKKDRETYADTYLNG